MRKGKGAFADAALRYADDVLSGKLPACWQIRRACQRFVDDADGDQWVLDAGLVEWACTFLELLPLLDGEAALNGQSLRLEPFQIWIVANLFGLTDDRGLRKHREAFLFLPRKNGKSTFASGIALLMFAADGEPRAQVYIGAKNLNQASYCFDPAVRMAQRAPGFAQNYRLTVTKKKLELSDGSFLTAMIGDPPDGSNPALAILDEAHENDNYGEQRQTMLTGMGARRQPLVITITTAGFNEAGPCRALQTQCEQVLSGELTNPRLFSAIWTIDKGDDWRDFAVWRKANPNYGVSLSEEFLREQYDKALTIPSEKPGLVTKHLNVWQSSSDAWVNMKDWDDNADAPPVERLLGRSYRAWVSADLSKVMDLTCVGALVEVPGHEFDEPREGVTLCFYPSFYLPEMALERESKNATAYQEWSANGHMTLTKEDATDFEAVERRIRGLCDEFCVQGIALDMWQAADMAGRLLRDGLNVMEYPQKHKQLHPPMSRFEKLIALGQVKHSGNPVMRWMTGNVVAHYSGEFIKPAKPPRRREAKIDGFVSLMMALGLSGAQPQETPDFHVAWG